jgi:hypothetical protein
MISFVDVVEYVLEQPYYDFKDDIKSPSAVQFETDDGYSDDTTSFGQQEFSSDRGDDTAMDISEEDVFDDNVESNTIKII